MNKLCHAKQYLNEKLEIEESLWKQKANIRWLKEGDTNTSFFHHTVQNKRQKLSIHRIRGLAGQCLENSEEIKNEVVLAFHTQLNGDYISSDDSLLEFIPHVISLQQQELLEQCPTEEEILNVIKSLSENSIAGPDGFNGLFYSVFW